jgi:hypothetical protein
LIKSNLRGNAQISPLGNYVIWFDREEGNWYVYEVNAGNTRLLNAQMSVSFADEDDDRPTQPSPYGIAGWGKDDTLLFVNDKYDVWVFDLKKRTHWSLTNGWGRKSQIELRYVDLEPRPNAAGSTSPSRRNNAQPIDPSKPLWLSAFNHVTKEYGWFKSNPKSNRDPQQVIMGPYRYVNTRGAEGVRRFVYTKENYEQSPNVYVSSDFVKETKLSETNPQQQDYNWGTVELFHWTTPKGHKAQGLVYKQEIPSHCLFLRAPKQ